MDKARLKELCERAAPGPWEGRSGAIFNVDSGYWVGSVYGETLAQKEHNTIFIAASRTALPDLLEENEELAEENRILLRCLNGSTKAKYTAEMYDREVLRANEAETALAHERERTARLFAEVERLTGLLDETEGTPT